MFTSLIAKILRKRLYKSQVSVVGDDFTAVHYSDSLIEALKWTMHGIYEMSTTQSTDHPKQKSITNGVFGQICDFKILSVTQKSISIFGYATPKNEDILFMTNQMVYVPEKILRALKKQDAKISDLDAMFK